MKRTLARSKPVLVLALGAGLLWAAAGVTRAAGPTINLSVFGAAFHNPIGIDFFETTVGTGRLLATANYPTGNPVNFELIDALGVSTPFTTATNLPDELKVATVKAGPCTGGFVVGTAFSGNGQPGRVMKINPNGTTVLNWAILPGETLDLRGSLYQDRACAFGGDLIVVTANEQNGSAADNAGRVWRINNLGVATLVADIGRHLEGVITLPNDPKYGPLAGTAVIGDEDLVDPAGTYGTNGRIWGVTPTGGRFTVGAPFNISTQNYPTNVPLHPEDLDLVPRARNGVLGPEGDLFAVDYGHSQILRAQATDFADKCGQILVTQEFPTTGVGGVPSGFSMLNWNAATNSFVVTVLANTGNAVVGHYEHVTFWGGEECATTRSAPLISIRKFTNGADADNPDGADVPNILPGSTVTWTYRVANIGDTSVPIADVHVTDNVTGLLPAFDSVLVGDADTILEPNEIWLYKATGPALDLTLPPPAGAVFVNGVCTHDDTEPARTAYTNIGRVTIPGATDTNPSSYCNPPPPGLARITGGGSIFATVNGVPNIRVTHGLELRCDPTDKRQSLEINWDKGNNFHLDNMVSVTCYDDPLVQPPPPPNTIVDTYAGTTLFNGTTGYHGFGYAVGTGTCNKLPATIYFILSDAGEPGTADVAEYHIVGGCTLDGGPALIDKGNHQFHKK